MHSTQLAPDREERARTDLFSDWTPDQAAEAKHAVLSLLEHPGWDIFADAVARDREAFMRELIDRPRPRESAADYEGKLGVIRGLDRFETLIDGIILIGEEAESG